MALAEIIYDTAANWVFLNPTLQLGQIGIESDVRNGVETGSGKAKRGTGVDAWNSLSYWEPAGAAVTGIAIGDTVTGATAGSVFFAGTAGVLAQNNTAFQWVNADTKLKLTAGAATKTPLEINLFAAQSADAFQIKTSGNKDVFKIGATGLLTIGNADNTANGQISMFYGGAQWFNADMGNARILIDSGVELKWNNFGGAVGRAGFSNPADTVIKVTDGQSGGGVLQMQEKVAPAAPSANNVYIYAVDNGAGKTQLMALFATGVAQQLAIEP